MTQDWNITGIGSNVQENPFNTNEGQTIISQSENFWARLFREGRPRMVNNESVDVVGAGTSFTYPISLSTSPGCVLYPKRVVITCNMDTEVNVRVATGIGQVASLFHVVYLKTGTPFVLEFDGEIACFEGGNIQIGARTSTAGTKMWGSIYGLEAMPGA